MRRAVIAAPLWVERAALRPARTEVRCTGMGERRSRRSAQRLRGVALLVAGVGGGLSEHVRVGDLVVATEVRAPDGTAVVCWGVQPLADDLRRAGLTVHTGPICTSLRAVAGADRRRLAVSGALAVDMESAWLAPGDGSPFAVVRAISDTIGQPLLSPAVIGHGLTALRRLRRAVAALDAWADAAGREPV